MSLLAITVMLRPPDVAPRSRNIDGDVFCDNVFRREWITIKEDYMEIYFFGIKNDYPRNGFRVCVPRLKEVLVCPLRPVERYMKVKEHLVAGRSTAPDFLTLSIHSTCELFRRK